MLTIQNGQFALDGTPFSIYSGAMHYFRVPREYWEDRLLKLKAAGFNTVETYVCWNLHEPQPGEFDFSGMLDVAEYLRLAGKLGLYAIVRPGPYICSEWDLGGLPAWLLRDQNMRLRCNYEPYLRCVRRYFQALGEQLHGLFRADGGNIIAVQIENEYGSYGNDQSYMEAVREMLVETGLGNALLFTSDGEQEHMLSGGGLPDVLKVINFGSHAKTRLKMLDAYQTDMPYMCGEFWCGWFDRWGGPHHTRAHEEVVDELRDFLDMGASFNLYMFHGGTNFGFTAGANCNKQYEPTVTSYDYGAPLTEWGDYTPLYHEIRRLLCERQGVPLGELPPRPQLQHIGSVRLDEAAGLFENLPNIAGKHHSAAPESMEVYGQNAGYILYSTVLRGTYEAAQLRIDGVHDNAYLYVDGKLRAAYSRVSPPEQNGADGFSVELEAFSGEKKIEIFVEALGHVTYGRHLFDRKGISRVLLGEQILFGFDVYTLPLTDLHALQYSDTADPDYPRFLKGHFKASLHADCFVDTTGFTKGCVFVNGFNLGRYRTEGPQTTLYVPKGILREENEIVVFELERTARDSIELTDVPQLGGTWYGLS